MWANILLWAIVVVYIGLILSTVTVVLLENRQPAKTIAWTIVLVMLPIVGFIIFYFSGKTSARNATSAAVNTACSRNA